MTRFDRASTLPGRTTDAPKEQAMKKKNSLRALIAGVALASVACVGGGAYALANITSVNVTGPDHERITFTVTPGTGQFFTLPATNDPMRVDLDLVSSHGAVQTPSEVFSALINDDNNNAGMSWIGTNSDGTQVAGNSIEDGAITQLVCGSGCLIASLEVASVTDHSLELKTNSGPSFKEKYVINIWY
jgi:hypothetical protein